MHAMQVNSIASILFLHACVCRIHSCSELYMSLTVEYIFHVSVYRSIAAVIVNSSQWAVALRYTAPGDKTTPFRELIRKMPSM